MHVICRNVFQHLDLDGSGAVSRAELLSAMSAAGKAHAYVSLLSHTKGKAPKQHIHTYKI
jgi:hypothetical protein